MRSDRQKNQREGVYCRNRLAQVGRRFMTMPENLTAQI
jgi:hypothetical protein